MALNLSPEKGVKLTKKDRAHVLKKMKQGWKATCLIPDYVFDENGNIQIASDKNRRIVRIVKFKDDGIHIENALKSKNLRINWKKIAAINKSKEVKNETNENIGARRLHSLLEALLEDISFNIPDMDEEKIVIDREYVKEKFEEKIHPEDIDKYIEERMNF